MVTNHGNMNLYVLTSESWFPAEMKSCSASKTSEVEYHKWGVKTESDSFVSRILLFEICMMEFWNVRLSIGWGIGIELGSTSGNATITSLFLSCSNNHKGCTNKHQWNWGWRIQEYSHSWFSRNCFDCLLGHHLCNYTVSCTRFSRHLALAAQISRIFLWHIIRPISVRKYCYFVTSIREWDI